MLGTFGWPESLYIAIGLGVWLGTGVGAFYFVRRWRRRES